MSFSRLLSLTVSEAARAAVFSVVVAGVGGFVGVGLWAADISLVQADVVGSIAAVALASVLPAFFGAWLFFLLRRIAWSSAAAAFSVGAGAAGAAVVAHHNVLVSQFFALADDGNANAGALWVQAALGLLARDGAVDETWMAEVAVVAGVGLAALGAQRWLAHTSVKNGLSV